jgi:hypothetical protein
MNLGVVASAAPWIFRASAALGAPRARPRFYIQIIPQGGMDPVYTTDPKKASEVDSGIDVPFGADQIVEAGMRLGPSFKALARWAPRLAIVNAFRQNSANHISGLAHVLRCKSRSDESMPTLLELLGARRATEATGAISIGAGFASAFSPRYLGVPSEVVFGERAGLFEHLDAATPDDLLTASQALRGEAARLTRRRPSQSESTTAANLVDAAELLSRTATAPRFAPSTWSHSLEADYQNGRDLQRALWLLEHGLTRCVTVSIGNQDFDTHVWNTTFQPLMNDYLASLLDKLFGELDRRKVEGRSLAEQTLVMIGSEIGRFPRLNAAHGKDHFPQVPMLFFGAGVAGGSSFGATDRSMTALPVALATGKPQRDGHVLRIDDIGTTLLRLDGANPESLGYTGPHLEFLVPG